MYHFVQCVAEGKPSREDFVDGYIANLVIDAAYRSAKSGVWEPVNLEF